MDKAVTNCVVTLLPTVPMVLFDSKMVTKPVPLLLTVPVMVLFVNVIVIGVLVLYVRFPVMATPVMLVGVSWVTLPVIVAPLANVPVLVTLPVIMPDKVPAFITSPASPADTEAPTDTVICRAAKVAPVSVPPVMAALHRPILSIDPS